ncbi:MAG: hypothetical protein QOG40_224 [Solirubrobacteraceae bacterium]|nr:hypothetical protein [Solirubrobacteraceae bacterium]
MAVTGQASESAQASVHPRRLFGGSTTGNERLTGATGGVLLVLLAIIGVTIVQLGQLLWVHLFVGMLLIAPVALKLASTGYRFVRYYTADPRYKRKGPPALPLRLIAPIVVLSTIVVFASGVALLLAGPSSRDTLLPIHKLSFIVWGVFMAVHVLAHLPGVLSSLNADYVRPARRESTGMLDDANGRAGRVLSLASALVLGLVLAILVIPQFGPWISAH